MTEPTAPRVRKRPLEAAGATASAPGAIDLAAGATIAYSSEDPAHPVENILTPRTGPGGPRWISARSNVAEDLVLEFDRPQSITRIVYEVEEAEAERTQEVRIEASVDGARTYRQVLVQEYTFSPHGATYEREDLRVDLHGVTHLRLLIVPHKQGSGPATLSHLQLFT